MLNILSANNCKRLAVYLEGLNRVCTRGFLIRFPIQKGIQSIQKNIVNYLCLMFLALKFEAK
jgi:hypothetical protein